MGRPPSLNTCGVNNMVGTNTNTFTSGTFLYPNGQCVPTGVGALVRPFRIGTNQFMDTPFDLIQGSTYDTGADPGANSGVETQNSSFTCNIVSATVVQCVIGPTYVNGSFSAIGQWSSNGTYASYGDPYATSGYISGMVGSVGGQNFPVTAGSGYPVSSSWVTGGLCSLTASGGFTATAPGMGFGVNSSGQIAGAFPTRLGNGIDGTCTFPLSFTFTATISGWSGVTGLANLVVTANTLGSIVPGEAITGGNITISGGAIVQPYAAKSSITGTYVIQCGTSTTCNTATSSTFTSGPTTGSGGSVNTLTTGPLDGFGGLMWNDTDSNMMGDFLYDNSGVAGNPNAGGFTIPSGGLESPGLAARPFGTRRGVEIGG